MANVVKLPPSSQPSPPNPPPAKGPGSTPITPTPDVDVINNIIINLDSAYLSIVNSLTNQVNKLVQDFNKIDDKIFAQLNSTIKAVESSNKAYYNRVEQGLKEQVELLNGNTETIINKLLKPILDATNRLEKDDLEFSKKAQISLEALLSQLIASQSNQTKAIVSAIEDSFADLMTTISETDYISEENLADWIKQALQPLEINWPESLRTYDELGNINPTNPFSILWDTFVYLRDRVFSVKDAFDKLERGEYSEIEQLRNDIFGSGISGELGESIFFMLMLVPLFQQLGQALFAKTFTELSFLARRKARASRPNVDEYFQMVIKDKLGYNDFLDKMRELGFKDEDISKLYDIRLNIISLADLFELRRRNNINQERLENELEKLGYKPTDAKMLASLAFFQPPVQDVIRFAVRDVYDDNLARLSNIFEGWDNPDYLRDASLAGLKPEHAKLYWGAHWILPSATQGFEMFQREQINLNELQALLRAADYAPAWREKLISIAYLLPTKVDVRRAYEDDIIDDDKLREYIRHAGTDPAWYEAIFNWYKSRKIKLQAKKDGVKSLSISLIIKAYTNGAIQQSEAVEKIAKLGYTLEDALLIVKANEENELLRTNESFTTKIREDMRSMGIEGYRKRILSKNTARDLIRQSGISEDLAEAMLSLIDEQYKIDRKAEIVASVRKLYLGYDISENVFYDTLRKNNFGHEEANALIEDIKPLRTLRFKELGRADVKKGISNPNLGIAWGIEKLKSMGYSDSTIQDIMLIEAWEELQNSLST